MRGLVEVPFKKDFIDIWGSNSVTVMDLYKDPVTDCYLVKLAILSRDSEGRLIKRGFLVQITEEALPCVAEGCEYPIATLRT